VVLVCSANGAWAGEAAGTYPARPVRWVVPFTPGASNDIIARLVGQKLTEAWGQQFIIDNRPGASGVIGSEPVAKAPPDGYTLMVHSTTHVANPHLMTKVPYDTLRDFSAVGLLCAQVGLLVVHPALPAKNVKELVALAKARPDQLLYGSSGTGSFGHLAMSLLTSMSNTRMVQVPYKGGGPAVTSLVSGETQLFISTPAAVMAQLQAGRVRALGVTADTRLARLPNIPTIAESGLPGYEMNSWVGVLAPAGLPKTIADFVNAEIKKVMDAPDMKSRLEVLDPWYMTPEQMTARVKADYEKFGKLIRMAGVKAE
jgi:tripartite-type tricarboxylate transporter receptor subunit TctC